MGIVERRKGTREALRHLLSIRQVFCPQEPGCLSRTWSWETATVQRSQTIKRMSLRCLYFVRKRSRYTTCEFRTHFNEQANHDRLIQFDKARVAFNVAATTNR
ncbi:uncharacterized protein PV09_06674 [Verruconis gallopava]|uniref:Uncharacterized protein n=1 Tax=Verruconis gallopava TaxID=253628 RepID=A0A0D1YLW7_9PEZI|nr:uncharacterized protein PV09_06674 [Verruconis gallopava]KIW01822.1 hypothetical protein PV09_06674 [Verruconis gallopava]